jgi:7-cyano-7-deazaguanine reductase
MRKNMSNKFGPLGEKSPLPLSPSADILFSITRTERSVPMKGCDVWGCYELTWLDDADIPQIGIGRIVYNADSPRIVESKSVKLYLGSFYQSQFADKKALAVRIGGDLSAKVGDKHPTVDIFSPAEWQKFYAPSLYNDFYNIDSVEISGKSQLKTGSSEIEERLSSHILRSVCPVTGQPDYGSVFIHYSGEPLDHGDLLKRIISYREHAGFHEELCERLYTDLCRGGIAKHAFLSVQCSYLRRGGIDITPVRCSENYNIAPVLRTFRQ